MIIFLYGEDSFRSRQKLLEIKNKYLTSDKSGSGLSSFDFEEKVEIENVFNALETRNLLSPKRLVFLENIISAGSSLFQEKVLDYLKKNKKEILEGLDLLVIFWEKVVPPKNNILFKFLESFSKKQNFEKLTGPKLNQWILRRMKEVDSSSKISKTALEKLILFCGRDSDVLDKEIQKLVNYASPEMISEKDVEKMVRANLDGNIFETIDAIGANNKKEALRLLHQHLRGEEDPFYLFSMFLYQFRNLLKIADLRESGVFSEYEISKITKMHPYVVKKALVQIRNFNFSKLKRIYGKLGELDEKIKTGKIEIKLALDKFVAEL